MALIDRMDSFQETNSKEEARRLKQMQDGLQMDALNIAQERAIVKAQQQELVRFQGCHPSH
jgi:hypothetical protein